MKEHKLIKIIFNKETILYAVFGFLTFLVGIVIYQGLIELGMDYKISNIFSLLLGKLFAYVTNKLFVFRTRNKNFIEFCKEFGRFVVTRGFTALIDYFGVIIAVECFCIGEIIAKYVLMVIVIILNYIFGKMIVFRKAER